ncbi:hypothetical protein IFT69_18445 [Pseudomonas putida]|nr:hypothetical protein [Pseudomonas putida]
MEFIIILVIAIGFAIWLTRDKKERPSTQKAVLVKGPTRKTGCDTCAGNCGQCGSSH